MNRVIPAVVVLAICLIVTPAFGDVFPNPSFDDTTNGTGWISSIPDWTATPATTGTAQRQGVFSSFSGYTPTDGQYMAVLTNNGGGAQRLANSSTFTISTDRIEFDYVYMTDNSPTDTLNLDPFTVSLVTSGGSTYTVADASSSTGTSTGTAPFATTINDTGWLKYTIDSSSFIGQTGYLEFRIDDSASLSGGVSGVLIDNVVPEPATLFLFGAGFIGLTLYGRRKLKRKK